MRRIAQWGLLVGLLLCVPLAQASVHDANDAIAVISVAQLPPQARETLQLIKRGGPFPYRRDGTVFGNYEKILPQHPRGYYHEYTVETPGAHDRGARRIVCGAFPECYYSDDHYQTFKRIREERP